MKGTEVLGLAAVLLTAACGELTYRSDPVGIAQVAVVPGSVRVHVGDEVSVQVQVLDAQGGTLSGRTVNVDVGDSRVAIPVGLSGVRAVSEGATTIRYTSEGVSVTLPVTVISTATRLSLSASRSTLYLGDSLILTASGFDVNGRAISTQNVQWASLNPANATVSGIGVVRGIAVGNAVISAQLGDAQTTAEFYVTDPLWWIRVEPSTNTLALGDSLQLHPMAVDYMGFALPGRVFTWRSPSPDILDVTAAGLAKAKGFGWGNLVVSSGSVAVPISLQVIPQPLASIAIVPATAIINVGDRLQLTYTLAARNGKPTSADGRWVRWSSWYPVNVDNLGVVTAFAPTTGSTACVSIDDQSSCATIIVR